MTTVTLRTVKGSPLTHAEVDANFSNLNQYKVEQDANGNAGLGVTPSAWASGWKAVEMPSGVSVATNAAGIGFLFNNAYHNGTNYIYKAAGLATSFYTQNGAYYWNTAVTGVAGDPVTWKQAMVLDANGNLLVSATGSTAGARIQAVAADGAQLFGVSGTSKGLRVNTDANKVNIQGVDTTLFGSYQPLAIGGSTVTLQFNGTTDGFKLDASGNLLGVGGGGLGYGVGSGGAVTQATSKTTEVTLNKVSGAITLNAASLAANSVATFTFTNSTIAATDVVQVAVKSGMATGGSYHVSVDAVNTGSCNISIRNLSAGALAEALVLNFVVIKGSAS